MRLSIIIIAILAVSAPAFAQLGGLGRRVQQAQERKQQFDDMNITEEEEVKLGAEVSAKIRQRFGVVQNPAVHKYVTLVGTMLERSPDALKLVAFVTCPLGILLSGAAQPIVLVVFGERWAGMIGPLAVLGIWAAVNATSRRPAARVTYGQVYTLLKPPKPSGW